MFGIDIQGLTTYYTYIYMRLASALAEKRMFENSFDEQDIVHGYVSHCK